MFKMKMLLSHGLVKSGGSSILVKFLSILLNLMIIPILYNDIGSYEFGLYSIFSALSFVIVFSDLGLSNTLVNEISMLNDRNQNIRLKKINTYFSILMNITFVLIIALCILFLIFKDKEEYSILFFIFFLFMFLTIPLSVIEKYLLSTGHYYVFNICHIIILLMNFCIIYVLSVVFDTLQLVHVVILMSIANLACLILCYIYIKFCLDNKFILKYNKIKLNKSLCKIRRGFVFFRIQAYSMINASADVLIIGSILGPVIAGKYSILKKLFNTVQIINFFFKPMWPYVNNLLNEKKYYELKRIFSYGLIIMIIIPIICSAFIVLVIDYLFIYFIKSEYDLGMELLLGFCLYTVIQGQGGLISTFMNTKYFINYQSRFLLKVSIVSILTMISLSHFFSYIYIPIFMFLIMLFLYIVPAYKLFKFKLNC